ncbi:hypothetical protein [Amycolatopsis sp. NPDC001319]|uniref:hypothetical protein n=1 Tax=unclassified Amycolatopsis TaxID=2618356 RepID=UPI0036A1D9BE
MADRTVSVKLRADIADYAAKMRDAGKLTRDLESAGRDLRKALDDEADAADRVKVSEAKLDEVRKNSKSTVAQLAAAEAEHASNLRKSEAAVLRTKEATQQYAAAQKKAATDVDNSGRQMEQTVSRVAARANAAFDAKLFAGLSVGLPAAAALGAAGVTAALGLIPALIVGLSAKFLIFNDQVTNSFGNLADDVQNDASRMAAVLDGPLVDSADRLRASYEKIRPEIEDVFAGSVPAVEQLTGAATDFAENAMPGVVASVTRSQPVLIGLRSLLGDTGAGLSDFLIGLSDGSQAAGQDLETLGHIVRDLEGFLGTFLANLAQGGNGPLTQFRGTLNQLEAMLLTVSSTGMPALQGATGGFLGTVSGGLAVVQTFVGLLGSWAAPLAQAGGSMLATNSIAKLFGTSLSETGFGLKALTPLLDENGNRTTAFKQAMSAADSAGTSKFKAGISSLASGGFNPLGIALIAGGALLDAWGKSAQDAATRAAEQRQSVADLTQAYLEDNNAIGANVRAATQKALSDKNAFTNSLLFGSSLQQTSAAALGGGAALDAYNDKAKNYIVQLLSGSRANRQMTPEILQAADAFAKQGGNAADLVNNLSAVRLHSLNLTDAQKEQLVRTLDGITATNAEARANDDAAKKAQALADAQKQVESAIARGTTPAMYAAEVAAGSLAAAWTTLDKTGVDVASAGQAIIDAMRTLAGQTPSIEEALQHWNDDLRGIGDAFKKLNLKGHSKDLVDAAGAINTTSEAGSKLQDTVEQGATDLATYAQSLKDGGASADEITAKLGPMRNAFAKQLTDLGLNDKQVQQIMQHYGLIPKDIVTQLGLEGDTETHEKISGIIKDLGSVPDNKGVEVTALTKEAESALTTLGYQVVALPNGKFQVFADTTAGQHAADVLRTNINQTKGTVTVYGDADPATGAVANWKTETTRTIGKTTVTTDISPATGQVRQWESTTDKTGAVTTTFSTTNPATGEVQRWKRNTDGTWATVNVNANAGPAFAILNQLTTPRTVQITYRASGPSAIGGVQIRTSRMNADGALYRANIGMADGGLVPTSANRLSNRGEVARPGTLKWAGDAKVDEIFAPLNGSARTAGLLTQGAIHEGLLSPNGAWLGGGVQQQILGGAASVQQITPRIVIQAPPAVAKSGRPEGANVTINTAQTDPNRLAAAMVSALAWQLR